MIGGDLPPISLAYLSSMNGHVSLIVFLALYFFSLWVAWMLQSWAYSVMAITILIDVYLLYIFFTVQKSANVPVRPY
jgi:hypothetical protein